MLPERRLTHLPVDPHGWKLIASQFNNSLKRNLTVILSDPAIFGAGMWL